MQHSPRQRRTNGFANILLLLGVGALLALGWYASTHDQANQAKFGASIQTQLTDTIGTFRTNVNTSLSTLDAAVATVTSTINAYGNMVNQNTPLANNLGGTGTTTVPTDLQYFGNNGSRVGYISLVASSGIILTTTTTSTIISTPGFSTAGNDTWTGTNTFQSSTAFQATSTFSSSTIIASGTLTVIASTTFTGTASSSVTFTVPPTILGPSRNASDTASVSYVSSTRASFLDSSANLTTQFSGAGTGLGATSSFTLTYPGHILVIVEGYAYNGTTGDDCEVDIQVDGSIPSGWSQVRVTSPSAGQIQPLTFQFITATLSAAAHTVGVVGNTNSGTCHPTATLQTEFIGN